MSIFIVSHGEHPETQCFQLGALANLNTNIEISESTQDEWEVGFSAAKYGTFLQQEIQ